MNVVMRVEPDSIVVVVVVKVVADPSGSEVKDAPEVVDATVGGAGDISGRGRTVAAIDEIAGVISGVLVINVLKRLGGAMLFNHCVVPLTTEK